MDSDKSAWRDTTVTQEALEAARKRIGVEYQVKPWNEEATKDAIWHFAYGIGDDNPLWIEPEYAAKTKPGKLAAPPTFLFSCCSGPGLRPGGSSSSLVLGGLFGMWTQDTFEWYKPVLVGDRFKVAANLHSVRERPSRFAGTAIEQVTETRFFNQRGELVARYWQGLTQFERGKARERQKYADVSRPRYTEEEMKAIEDAYLAEDGWRRGASPRCWEDVSEGELIHPLVKGPLTYLGMAVFLMGWGSPVAMANRIAVKYLRASPSDRLVNLETNIPDTIEGAHFDEHFAVNSGIPAPYDFGPMRFCWCAHVLTDWMGDGAFLKRLSVQLRRPNLLGDTTWVRGKVSAKYWQGQEALVDCDVWCENQRHETTAVGQATVVLPLRSGQV